MGILLREAKSLYSGTCANIGQVDVPTDTTIPASVSISPSSPTLAATAGSTTQLTASVLPSTAIDKSVTWSSSDTSVATVNSSGLVTRVAPLTSDDNQPHTATITATTTNGKTASVTISAAVLTLPTNAWGVYDGINGAKAKATIEISGNTWPAWEDDGGNENHTLHTGNILQSADAIWGSNYLDCPVTNCIGMGVTADDFDPSDGYTFNFLADYDTAATGADSTNNLDTLICIKQAEGNAVREQLYITERGDTTNPSQLCDAVNLDDGNGWARIYNGTQLSLGGKHLITLKVSVSSSTYTATMYLDGTQLASETQTKDLSSISGSVAISICAHTVANSSLWSHRKFLFFGKVYAASIYNRALTDDERAAVKTFYDSRYPNSN